MNAEARGWVWAARTTSSPVGLYDDANFSCAADLAMLARAGSRTAAHSARGRHRVRRAALADQGREAVALQQQPAADLPLPRRDRPEDGRHRSRRALPGGDRRRDGVAWEWCCSLPRTGPPGRATARRGASTTSTTSRCRRLRPCRQGRKRSRRTAPRLSARRALIAARRGVPFSGQIDWSVSQRRTPWISTTHPSRPRTARRCAPGWKSTSREAPVLQGPGALERRGRDHRRAARLAGQARRGRPRRRDLAEGVRRAGARADRAGDLQPGDRRAQGARHPRRDRRGHARPDDHRPRRRGAEGALPRPDAARRRGLVPAVLRARRRLGPGGGAGPRPPAGRRQLAAERPEGVDHQRAVRLLRAAARAHRRRRAQAQGPDDVHRADGRAPA